MRITRLLIILFFVSKASMLFGQTNRLTISFGPVFNKLPLVLEKNYSPMNNPDSFRINSCKFYISGIELLQNAKLIYKEKKSFHLLDAAEAASMTLMLNTPKDVLFNQIKFNIGIDSTTNASGAIGGDLDPTKGMYWTWQSGYINVKLEGQCSNLCKTRNNEFEFHLGGYCSLSNLQKCCA